MCVDPVKRASLTEILEHEWIKDDHSMIFEANAIMNIEQVILNECDMKGTNKRSLDNSESNSQNDTYISNVASNRKRLKNLDLI